MKVLVIGGGGREHAIAWKLSRSRHITGIYSSPGNAGMAEIAECVDLSPNGFSAIVDFVKYEWIDLTIVCDERFLSEGIVDFFGREGRKILGPDRRAARMMSSRAEAKNLMRLYGIPTAEYKIFSSYLHALDYIRLKGTPIVIKADGCAGSCCGSFVAASTEDATEILKKIMEEKVFGDAGRRVIIEDMLEGERLSVVALTDGKVIRPIASLRIQREREAMSSKAMGAYSPVHAGEREITGDIMGKITVPLLKAFHAEGIKYKGFISLDLITNGERTYVFELNCCLGDLESQTVFPRLKTDLVEVAMAVIEERLSEVEVEMEQNSATCIVGTAEGDPESREFIISGLEKVRTMPDVVVFHENTAFSNSNVVSTGGRVISLSATGKDLHEAREKAYRAIEEVHFEGMRYSRDIGI